MKKLILLAALLVFSLPCFAGFKIISDDGTVTNLTGIVDSAGDYHTNGILDSASTRYAEGILDWDGNVTYTYHSYGLWDVTDLYAWGILDQNSVIYGTVGGTLDSSGVYNASGIVDGNGIYYSEGVLDWDGSSTYIFYPEGILNQDGPTSFTYHYAGIVDSYAFYSPEGLLDWDGVSAHVYHDEGILDFDGASTYTYYPEGILDWDGSSTSLFYPEGILDWDGSSTSLFYPEGILDWDGNVTYTYLSWGLFSSDGIGSQNAGLLSDTGINLPEGIFDGPGGYLVYASGILNGASYYPEGILDWDGNVTYTYYLDGILDTVGYYTAQPVDGAHLVEYLSGILNPPLDDGIVVDSVYYGEGILTYNIGSSTYTYFAEGILDWDGSSTYTYSPEGLLDWDGVSAHVYHDEGILDWDNNSTYTYYQEGILDWDGSYAYTYYNTGVFDGTGYFSIDNAIHTITGGGVYASNIGTLTSTDNLTPEILKAGKTVDDVVGASPPGGGGINGSAILGMP